LSLVALTATAACEPAQVVNGFPESYVGVGMELRIEGSHPIVVRTIDGGSAADAGIEPGDRVVSIDGQTTDGNTLGDVVMRIRGEPGTQVTLGVRRGDQRLMVVIRRRTMAKQKADYRPTER
jgi:carboxyl-terminal processing protease